MFTSPDKKHGRQINFQKPGTAVISLFSGALMISFSGVWVEICEVSPATSAFYRVLFGGLVLAVLAFYNAEIKWHGIRHLLLALLCALFFALDLIFYHASIKYVGPGLGTILPNFQVFILAGAGILLFKEKFRVSLILSVPIAFTGLIMIVGLNWRDLETLYKAGLLMGLAAAVFYSCFLLLLKNLQSTIHTASFFYVLMLVSLVTALFISFELIATGGSFQIPSIRSFAALAALGFFSQSIGWILIANALPHIRTSLSGLILLIQPAMAFVWDVLFFQRPTTLSNWIGVFITLAAIYTATARHSKSAP